jgi:hypothetical protein
VPLAQLIDGSFGCVKLYVLAFGRPFRYGANMPSTSVPPPAIDALPRQSVRDPDFWLLAITTLALCASGIQLLVFPFGRSIASHALLGRAILLGGAPARDVWVAHAPGIGLLHAAVQTTLGHSMMAFRTLETLAVVAAVLAGTRITKQWVGLERAGLLGGALFTLTYVQLEVEYTGQPEFFAGVLLLLATALCAREPAPRSRWALAALVGCLLGTLTIFVPSFALVALAFPRLFTRRIGAAPLRPARAWQLIGCMAFGFVLPIALVACWLKASGAAPVFLRDYCRPLTQVWFSQSVIDLLAHAFTLALKAMLNQSALITAGLLATFVLGTLHEYERPARRELLVLFALLIMGLSLQNLDNPGALSAVLPFTALLAGVGIYKTWRRVLPLGAAGAVAFWTIAIFLFQMRAPLRYPPGTFVGRSKTRLLYLAGQASYRSREMLEAELYSVGDYNLASTRRVATSLKARSLTNRGVWVAANEPQLAWMLDGVPTYRFIEPLPSVWAAAAPELARRASDEANALASDYIVTAGTASAGEATVRSHARLSGDYALLEVIDNSWRVYQRVRKPLAAEDEFCDPNRDP